MNYSTHREVLVKMISTTKHLLILPLFLALYSCVSDYSQCNDYFTPNEEEYLLTVDEARDFF